MNPSLLLAALLSGLVGSPHCVGMCGGLATAATGKPAQTALYHAGRLGTYAALGAAAGALGHALPGPVWLPMGVAALLLAWFALRLSGLVGPVSAGPLGRRLPRLGAQALTRGGALGHLGFGVVNGLLPCGLVYAALALPVAAGGAAAGAAGMLAFGLGTVPALSVAGLSLRRLAAATPHLRRAVAAVVFLAGLGGLAWRAPLTPDGPPACHTPAESP